MLKISLPLNILYLYIIQLSILDVVTVTPSVSVPKFSDKTSYNTGLYSISTQKQSNPNELFSLHKLG